MQCFLVLLDMADGRWESEDFLDPDTVPATSLGDEQSFAHPLVPAPLLYQQPSKSAIFVCKYSRPTSQSIPQPNFFEGKPHLLSSSSDSPALQPPLPILLILLKSCFQSLGRVREQRYPDLSFLPTRLAAARRFECSCQLGGEPHPQVSVLETPCRSPLRALVQLETLARCLATGPPRTSLLDCSVMDVAQVLHRNKQHQTSGKPLS